MKRRVLAILLFLLAGAVANVAVAWGLAVAIDSGGRINESIIAGWHQGRWKFVATIDDRAGAVSAAVIQTPKSPGADDDWFPIFRRPEHVDFPAWSMAQRVKSTQRGLHQYRDGLDLFALEEARGWPLVSAFSSVCRYGEDPFVLPDDVEVLNGWRLPRFGSDNPGPTGDVILPLKPIWPAFVFNTLFYAALIWLGFCGPFALRRRIRRKRGRCLKCGYDLRGELDAGCPECGWRRKEGGTASERSESAV